MTKLLLTLLMMFAFGTSTVNAEENTTNIEDRIDELAEVKSDSRSSIMARIDELSKDELKVNVNEFTEPTEDDLAIKEAATNKLEEIEEAEVSPLTTWRGFLRFGLMFSSFIMLFVGYILWD